MKLALCPRGSSLASMVKPALPIDIYVRVSRVGKRGETLISPDQQERRARAHATAHDLRVGKVLPADLDESGGKLDRPGLNEALRRVESGESGGIIVAWLDRLSRDSEHAHGLVRRINQAGGVIYAPDAPADWTTPEGELQAGFVFLLATSVRKRARAGFERAREQAIERGIPENTRAAVGYRKRDGEGQDRRLELHSATAPVVREVFERRAAGAGPTELAALLEREGVPTSQGSGTWSKQAVYSLLSNRVYLGELRYGRDGRFVNAESHDPIVELPLWTAAQHPNGRSVARVGETSAWLLAGILRCHACRYCMQGTTTSRGKRIYRCTRRHAGGICPHPAASTPRRWRLRPCPRSGGSRPTLRRRAPPTLQTTSSPWRTR
jgi:DNA invertase Pin-like site-specific DNA recombinase